MACCRRRSFIWRRLGWILPWKCHNQTWYVASTAYRQSRLRCHSFFRAATTSLPILDSSIAKFITIWCWPSPRSVYASLYIMLLLVPNFSLIYYLLDTFSSCRFCDASAVGCFINETQFSPKPHWLGFLLSNLSCSNSKHIGNLSLIYFFLLLLLHCYKQALYIMYSELTFIHFY